MTPFIAKGNMRICQLFFQMQGFLQFSLQQSSQATDASTQPQSIDNQSETTVIQHLNIATVPININISFAILLFSPTKKKKKDKICITFSRLQPSAHPTAILCIKKAKPHIHNSYICKHSNTRLFKKQPLCAQSSMHTSAVSKPILKGMQNSALLPLTQLIMPKIRKAHRQKVSKQLGK